MPNGVFNAVYSIRFGDRLFVWACFLSLKVFKVHFAERRKEEGQKMIVTPWKKEEGFYSVLGSKGNVYHVATTGSHLICNCEDYKNQQQFLKGRRCCKHGYGVLFHLGFNSLQDYIDSGGDPSLQF